MDALRRELPRRALVGAEEERRQPVDLDPVPFLRHRQVEAAQARFDVRDRHFLAGRVRAGQRRVGIAHDDHPIGPLALDRLADRRRHRYRVGRPQVEPVARLGQFELVVEDLRHLGVPVLPGVEADLFDCRLAIREREGRRLDELRPVSNDRENAHAALRYAALPGR